MLQDIVVWARPDEAGNITYQEIFGFKRLTASRIAGYKDIPAKVLYDLTEKDAAVIMAGEHAGRSNPSAWSMAKNNLAYIEGTNIAKNATALATILGEKPETVRNRLRIARNMPESFKASLSLHRFGVETLFALINLSGPPDQHSANQAYIRLVLDSAEDLNNRPKQAKSLISRLVKKYDESRNPEAASPKKEVNFGGKPAFSWNLTAKGGKVTIHQSIRHLITDSDLEEALSKIVQSKKDLEVS